MSETGVLASRLVLFFVSFIDHFKDHADIFRPSEQLGLAVFALYFLKKR